MKQLCKPKRISDMDSDLEFYSNGVRVVVSHADPRIEMSTAIFLKKCLESPEVFETLEKVLKEVTK